MAKKRDIGTEILDSLHQLKAGQTGRVSIVLSPDEIKAVRAKLGLSQANFANLLNISTRTLQDWEQGRRQPHGPARSLLAIAAKRPDVVKEVLLAA